MARPPLGFAAASKAQKTAFEDAVRQNNGTVLIGVHPHGLKHLLNYSGPESVFCGVPADARAHEPYLKAINSFLADAERRGLPVVLTEDEKHAEKTADLIAEKFPRLKGMVVPTFAITEGWNIFGGPTPKMKEEKDAANVHITPRAERHWNEFARALKEMGATNADVFGQKLEFKDGDPGKCVGTTMKKLKARLPNGAECLQNLCFPPRAPR